MDWAERRERFRAILGGERCVRPASVFDPLSARVAAELGFETAMFAGSTASLTVLGAPDLILLTLSEFAAQCYRINRAGAPPLMVDADHGYGNALNAMRTVEELETAGVSGLSIEDTALPANFGAADKMQLAPIAEGVGKMRASLAGRQDPRLCVVGRTSAISVSGLEDTIARGKAYEEAGVDALFFVGLKNRAQLDAIAEAVELPLILGSIGAELEDMDYLAARRVRICLLPHLPIMAAVQAVHDTMKAQREGVPAAKIPGLAPSEFMQRLTRDESYKSWSKEYL